jgi:hypothetical protein
MDPACDMVLVHDDDLECINLRGTNPETMQPDALMERFRSYEPTIHRFQCSEHFEEP